MHDHYFLFCYIGAISIIVAFINQRFFALQPTIAETIAALMMAFSAIVLGKLELLPESIHLDQLLNELHFNELLLKSILGFLLFTGGLSINLRSLYRQRLEIAVLAIFSTALSVALCGFGLHYLLKLLGYHLDLIYCLLFGAVISPTDPIAVLAIVKKLKAPEAIATKIEGESLFNDGLGLVVFVTLSAIAFEQTEVSVFSVGELFLKEVVGGIVFGFVAAWLVDQMIRHSHQSSMVLLLSAMLPTAGYAMAQSIEVSGPLAMVVAGIYLGNVTREHVEDRHHIATISHFWHVVESWLNNIIFLLLGLVILSFDFHSVYSWLLAAIIPLVLLARLISIGLPFSLLSIRQRYNPLTVPILVWGGLRGGLSLAMAMSIPAGISLVKEPSIDLRELIIMMTFSCVIFSIIVQGLTIKPIIRKANSLEH